MIEIKPGKINDCNVSVPGSKSFTHRILLASALSHGVSRIRNCLKSEDTLFTRTALKQMGIGIEEDRDEITVLGGGGIFKPCDKPIYLGNSGTSMRLLTAAAALGRGSYTFTGIERMQERPVDDLIQGLRQAGVTVNSLKENGCPPVKISGGEINGGSIELDCGKSSQFLSALLLVAPCTSQGLDITVTRGPVSRPYIDMTVQVMENFGISINRSGYERFRVPGAQSYRSGRYTVEPDSSQAGYFWAAAAITGAKIKVRGIVDTSQGDVRFTELLEQMGCKVFHEHDGIAVCGGKLSAIETDMADMPDLVPTLSVDAAFAQGTTVIKNVAHLKDKESDRLAAVQKELSKMGIRVETDGSGIAITGGSPHGAEIDTYGDHRIAMSFSIAGLRVPGIFIRNEKCVEKSFPEFWNVFERLYDK